MEPPLHTTRTSLAVIFITSSLTLTLATGAPPASLSLPFQPHLHHGRQGNRNQGNINKDSSHGNNGAMGKARELWLEDFSKDYLNEMQSDGVGRYPGGRSTKVLECPPPFNALPRDACDAPPCQSDKECPGNHCCYNGCIFTCMAAMPPPPVVDWRMEPPRKEWGKSWLIPASNYSNTEDAEYCSTSHNSGDGDGLLCPHGYICHIEHLGDQHRGIPNRGRCIPTIHRPNVSHKMFQMKSHNSNSSQCIVPGNGIYRNGTRFRYQRHMCQCQKGMVTCKVGRG